MAKAPKSEDQAREDEVLRRMLNTPPEPHKLKKRRELRLAPEEE